MVFVICPKVGCCQRLILTAGSFYQRLISTARSSSSLLVKTHIVVLVITHLVANSVRDVASEVLRLLPGAHLSWRHILAAANRFMGHVEVAVLGLTLLGRNRLLNLLSDGFIKLCLQLGLLISQLLVNE